MANKSCLNCEFYLKVKGHTPLGQVYFCNPKVTKKFTDHQINYYTCDRYARKYNIPQEIDELFGKLKR